MSTVARTCTEIGPDGATTRTARPLSEFRDDPVYVLLGDPGAGKTTEFTAEKEALGETAVLISARDFITLDLDSHPEWRDETLFIDGLDEMRSSAGDSRAPLDEIRNRLDRLGRPKFRLSCREADWLGHNDRRRLEVVSPGPKISVLRLDPLSHQDATELLGSLIANDDLQQFVGKAQELGFSVLDNPLTLKLLAEATSHGATWPTTRLETFEMACKVMSAERNDEHQFATETPSTETLMDAAGYLCALQLFTDSEGFSLTKEENTPSLVSLSAIEGAEHEPSLKHLKRAVSTRLFTGVDEQRFSPVHRYVSEFLGGRYLAKVVADGLPARRVVALMTSPSDGRVVTSLRGLSAWMAAHSAEARQCLIDADPVGVGLYGDIGSFTATDKERLLKALANLSTREHLLGHAYGTAEAFRSLASAQMASPINELLSDTGIHGDGDRIVEFVLKAVSKAVESELGSLACLAPVLEEILFNASGSSPVRTAALDAYLHVAPAGDTKSNKLTQLLKQAHSRTIPDPDDELRGTLLTALYPNSVPPSDAWQYITLRNRPNFTGRFERFWRDRLLELSSDRHIAELLDSLCENASSLNPVSDEPYFKDLQIDLLVHGLESHGETIDHSRLYSWLDITGGSLRNVGWNPGSSPSVEAWLEAHPQIQKEVFLTWLKSRDPDELRWHTGPRLCFALHRSALPADFGRWCLEQAVEIGDVEPAISHALLTNAYFSRRDSALNKELSLEIMHDRTRGHGSLAQLLDELCKPPALNEGSDALEREDREWKAKHEDEQRQKRADWESLLRSSQTELRENRFSPPNLHTLANVYFDNNRRADGRRSPQDCIRDFIGGDPHLVDLVMDAFNRAVWRDDVPEASETIALHSESKQSWLARPVLASLSLHRDNPPELDNLEESQKRNTLAIYYCLHARVHINYRSASHCLDRWLDQDPSLVLETLFQCAVSGIRAGEEYPPGLEDLDLIVGLDDEVNDLRLRLLDAYPTRGSHKQLRVLDQLLAKARSFPDKTALRALVAKKLTLTSMTVAQRVRWLTIGALISPSDHRKQWKEFVSQSEKRIRYLAEFLRGISDGRSSIGAIVPSYQDPKTLRDLVEMLGPLYPPTQESGFVTLAMDASDQIYDLIDELGSQPTGDADQALTELVDNPRLEPWRYKLTWSRQRQNVALSDHSFAPPTIENVQRTLRDLTPANANDLLALLEDRLFDISDDALGGNSNLWRQFWNEGSHQKPISPKHEDSCRDALLASLQKRLPDDVDAQPEGHYAAGGRADIRVSYGGFNVPIEIKKNTHRNLWRASRNQLIAQYTTDPDTSGHGIYLVLWFGADDTTRPPDGNRPETPDELKQRLKEQLNSDQKHKVSVIVIDVTKPGDT